MALGAHLTDCFFRRTLQWAHFTQAFYTGLERMVQWLEALALPEDPAPTHIVVPLWSLSQRIQHPSQDSMGTRHDVMQTSMQ